MVISWLCHRYFKQSFLSSASIAFFGSSTRQNTHGFNFSFIPLPVPPLLPPPLSLPPPAALSAMHLGHYCRRQPVHTACPHDRTCKIHTTIQNTHPFKTHTHIRTQMCLHADIQMHEQTGANIYAYIQPNTQTDMQTCRYIHIDTYT